jgi:hypothetical protein
MVILEDWSRWMKKDSHRLGYPNKVSYLSSGGESTSDVFEHMVDESDKNNVKIVNACIDSLPIEQKKAIYYSNRSMTSIKSENYALALFDAKDAIKNNPKFAKAYYRAGAANLALNQYS